MNKTPMQPNSEHELVCCISCGRDTRNASRICTHCGGMNYMSRQIVTEDPCGVDEVTSGPTSSAMFFTGLYRDDLR